jgi:hypothetical protein
VVRRKRLLNSDRPAELPVERYPWSAITKQCKREISKFPTTLTTTLPGSICYLDQILPPPPPLPKHIRAARTRPLIHAIFTVSIASAKSFRHLLHPHAIVKLQLCGGAFICSLFLSVYTLRFRQVIYIQMRTSKAQKSLLVCVFRTLEFSTASGSSVLTLLESYEPPRCFKKDIHVLKIY